VCLAGIVLSTVSYRHCPVAGFQVRREYFFGATIQQGVVHLGLMHRDPLTQDYNIFAATWTGDEVVSSYLAFARSEIEWSVGGESAGVFAYLPGAPPDHVKSFFLLSFPAWVLVLVLAIPVLRGLYCSMLPVENLRL
jgi:hypothetical protein